MTEATWTYPNVGVTRTGAAGAVPEGYRRLHVRHRLGSASGPGDLGRLGEALLTWQVHAAAGISMQASAPRAAPGVDAETRLGFGPLRPQTPCRVVWVEKTRDRVAFGYGTLPGHLFSGEEAFAIEQDDAGHLWLVATAVSCPQWRMLKPVGPLVRVVQRLYLRLLARGARRVLRAGRVPSRP